MKNAMILACLVTSVAYAPALAQSLDAATKKRMIEDAERAAPESVTAQATIKTLEGEVLRKGSNSWVCYPGEKLNNGRNAMCLDPVWQKVIGAWKDRSDVKVDRLGLAYMLAGDEGASNTDPFATSDTGDNQWVVEGPHLMVAVPDPASLEGLPTDPGNGGPYVMWKGTPYVHVMVPLETKRGAH